MLEVRHPSRASDRLDALYITYDGLLEPLGRSQIEPYARGLAGDGLKLAIISFEKPKDFAREKERKALESRLAAGGILWTPLVYHRRPRLLATSWDLLRGAHLALRLARRYRPGLIHTRSYVPSVLAKPVKRIFGARFLFDMRGFWPEERVELGLFRPHSVLYRISKRFEQSFLESADHVVVLTESAKAILREREASATLASRSVREKNISVIPCCADLNRFNLRERDIELARSQGLEDYLVIGNIGAVNRRYMLPEMFRFAFHVKTHKPEMRFVYLTAQDAEHVRALARESGLRDEDLVVRKVTPDDVPRWLSLFRLGIFFLRPSYAAKASSFTKLGEFLASGVPVVTNTGVGDIDRILGPTRCGFLATGMTDRDLASAAHQVLPLIQGNQIPPEVRDECRRTAEKYFALGEGVRRYLSIYRGLAGLASESGKATAAAEVA